MFVNKSQAQAVTSVEADVDYSAAVFCPTHCDRQPFFHALFCGDSPVRGESEDHRSPSFSVVPEALRFFNRQLDALQQEQHTNNEWETTLVILCDTVLHGLSFTAMVLQNGNACDAFEGLEERREVAQKFWGLQAVRAGADLGEADLIRNLLISTSIQRVCFLCHHCGSNS